MKRIIQRDAVYPHAPELVWHALTDSKALATWLLPNDFRPVEGHRFEFRDKPHPGFDGVVRCEVLEVRPPRRLSYTWKGGPLDTIVTFELEPVVGGTKLRLTHSGFRGFKAGLIRLLLNVGWRSLLLKRIRQVLDQFSSIQSNYEEARR